MNYLNYILLSGILLFFSCSPTKQPKNEADSGEISVSSKIPVILDTDTNNELDDQHAMAYLFFNESHFDIVGVTVNATPSGGEVRQHYLEAERVMNLCDVRDKYPLHTGANSNFEDILPTTKSPQFDGEDAVNFIVEESRKSRSEKLVLVPVGKLTNIALALSIAPDIKDKIKIVWLGANYPEKGEYNLVADIPAMNYVLNQDVPFEMVTVRYGKPSGSDAVRITLDEVKEVMPGLGPKVAAVTGRHEGQFTNFGDYSVSLFENIKMHGDPPSRALFDMVALAILKNPKWGESKEIPRPIMENEEWIDRPDNNLKMTLWENFDNEAMIKDFLQVMKKPE